ncbi:MAG: sigma-54-dependent Fis family transcriptional regulator [Xylophilus ampelinus]
MPTTDPTTATGPPPALDELPPDAIALAHRRSSGFGLRADDRPDGEALSLAALGALRDEHRALCGHALPVMETLFRQIAGTRSMVLLTDPAGTLLHALGDADFLQRAERVALRPGVGWSEDRKGTNAIGTALAAGSPVQIHARQHFLRANHFLTCSCAPILNPQGRTIGALDVSGDHRSQGRHTLALVRMSAQMVENQLFAREFADAVRVHFHARAEFLGTLMEGCAAFAPDGRFLSANRSAQFQWGLPLAALQAHTFSSLFGSDIAPLLARCRQAAPGPLALRLRGGVNVVARAEYRSPAPVLPASAAAAPCPAPAPEGAAGRGPARPQAGLAALDTGDPQLGRAIAQVRKLLGRAVPTLVLGETGTGKEWLARAMHEDSPRRAGPFVAINCAAIPETLIESELFGYADGAFTGARRRGHAGRIAQAHGGTLFLDEIGDMPLPLQARLLRVLQERAVVPLGGDRPVPVDVAVVCATHRDLRALRAAGGFRDDLYYRLNGLVVRLPPLRDRTDLPALVDRLLAEQAGPGQPAPPRPDAEVDRLFVRHPWPGNLRQLASVLRTAALLAEGEDRIRREHLPEDFLDEAAAPEPPAACADAAACADGPWRAGAGRGPAPAGPGAAGDADAADAADAEGPAGMPGMPRAGHFPPVEAAPPQPAAPDLPPSLHRLADQAVAHALDRCGGNVSAAARALGVSRNTVYRHAARRASLQAESARSAGGSSA